MIRKSVIFPISQLDLVRDVLKAAGRKVAIRYRGPRNSKANPNLKSTGSFVYKDEATGFTVYYRDVPVSYTFRGITTVWLAREPAFLWGSK